MEAIRKVLDALDAAGISYGLVEHEAVLTIEAMDRLHLEDRGVTASALSFASEERLKRFLGLEKGAVTPLGVLNDEERAVEVVFDRELAGLPSLGVHPNRNTATVFLAFADLEALVRAHGNPVSLVDLP